VPGFFLKDGGTLTEIPIFIGMTTRSARWGASSRQLILALRRCYNARPPEPAGNVKELA
jgi:hypothetical protein